jgi:hypothetical protein
MNITTPVMIAVGSSAAAAGVEALLIRIRFQA